MTGPARQAGSTRLAVLRPVIVIAAAGGVLLGCASSAPEESRPAVPISAEPSPAESSAGQTSPSEQEEAGSPDGDDEAPDAGAEETKSEGAEAVAEVEAAAPQRVQIPSIDLDEDQLVDLQIQADGRLEPPADWDDVGWFAEGSRLGEAGPTVIAAHVDSRSGPAVFYRLSEMVEGDEVTVLDAEGREHSYQVVRTADYPKDEFPTREVFGAGLEDELRLITCIGEYDDAAGRHLDNRVVFAARVP